ncbi:MAG: LysR family transcriptional regulator [Gemmataceae bacterium]|nr:LysR family transcriptional regulator [Gemmataceae bacterium]
MGRTLYYKGIQLPQLRSFCAVAVHGSFTAAARQLGLSKPTVWQQVRALERELKVTLLRLGGRGVELTAEGNLLLKLIQPHVTGLDSLVRLFETQRTELQQSLTVASTPGLISHALPAAIQAYSRANPAVRLHLLSDMWTDKLIECLDRRQVDLGIVPFHRSETRNANLAYEELFKLQFTLLTARDHPLARKRRVSAEDLVQYPIIKGAGYNQQSLEELLRRHDLLDRMHVVMESVSTDIIVKYVGLGIGIALVYVGNRTADWNMGDLHTRRFDPEETDALPVALMYRKGAHLPDHVEAFCKNVRRHLAGG